MSAFALLVATFPLAGARADEPGFTPKGLWEGEIELLGRPIVFSVDFDRRQGRLSTTRATAFPLNDLKGESGEIRFELRLEGEVVSIRAESEAEELRGTAAFADMQGRSLARGSFLLRRVPDLPTVHSREPAWQQDLDVVLSRFLPHDRSFSSADRREYQRRILDLKNSVSRRSDAELMVELARAVALSRNAHTRLYLVRNRTEVRRLPIRVWWFRDGLYVVRATEEYKDLLGCRVEKIGGTATEAAAGKVAGIKPGNASWQRYMSAYLLTSSEFVFRRFEVRSLTIPPPLGGMVPRPFDSPASGDLGGETSIKRPG